MKFEYQDDIDDYLLNRMSEEQQLAFEKEINRNPELQEQLDFTKNSVRALKSRNDKLAALKEWEKDYVWKEQRHKHIQLYWISGVAALFIVTFFIILKPNIKEDLRDPNAVEFEFTPFDVNTIKNSSDYSDIESLLKGKSYKKALESIEKEMQLLKSDSTNIGSKFVFNYEEYQTKMLNIRKKQDELCWLKVYALLGLNNTKQALLILDELRHRDGLYQIPSDSLYNLLKSDGMNY